MKHKPTNILLPAEMMAKLAAISKSTDLSVSEHVRRAIDMYLCVLPKEEVTRSLTNTHEEGMDPYATYRVAWKKFNAIRDDYRARKCDDATFIRARAEFEDSKELLNFHKATQTS